jgi:NADPH-dependent 2,4-dienoyl-CoA reductase/sulfur reductase-like enzyme
MLGLPHRDGRAMLPPVEPTDPPAPDTETSVDDAETSTVDAGATGGPSPLGRVVIVGASLAGLRAAETLRTAGHTGEIVVVGDEPHAPYDRPPLSKKVLAGEWEPDRIALRKPDDMASLEVTWRLGTRAVALDPDRRVVTVAAAADRDATEELGYDGLVIATGAVPRRLPGQPAAAYVLRSLDDALALRARFAPGGQRVVVIGAGFIGLEAAATARALGNEVIVLEGADAPLVRGLGAEMGRAVTACHADHGVEIRCGVSVASIELGTSGSGSGSGTGAVVLGDGTAVPADVVLVGIGVAPATDWLAGSGLEVRDGVVCDETLAVRGVTGIVAAGDVARWPNPLFDEEMRVEHWTNAAEQGALAASNLLAVAAGRPAEVYAPVPFFWSDQYDRRVQFLGRASAEDEVRIVSGSVEERRFLALYGREGRLRGALGLNSPKLVMPYRRLLAARATWDEALAHAASQG